MYNLSSGRSGFSQLKTAGRLVSLISSIGGKRFSFDDDAFLTPLGELLASHQLAYSVYLQ